MTEPTRPDVAAMVERARRIRPGRPDGIHHIQVPGPGFEEEVAEHLADRRARAWAAAIPSRFAWAKIDDLDPDVADAVREWDAAGAGTNLVLLGPVGTGKTHAAVAAARLCAERGLDVAFLPVVELLDALRPGGPDGAMEDLTSVDVLVLDDVGSERPTDWTAERLYALINRRWLEERRTIATSNLDPDPLREAVGERIYSRLAGGAVAHRLSGADRRRARRGS